MNFGVSSMVLPLKKVALLRPGASLLEADINKWHYSNIFNPDKVQGIYNNFVNLLTDEGVEIFWIEENTNIADAIFTYDASMMTKSGAILMSPAKNYEKVNKIYTVIFINIITYQSLGKLLATLLQKLVTLYG